MNTKYATLEGKVAQFDFAPGSKSEALGAVVIETPKGQRYRLVRKGSSPFAATKDAALLDAVGQVVRATGVISGSSFYLDHLESIG